MCWVDKCCFFVPLDFGCLLLGAFTFVVSLAMCIMSAVLLAVENGSAEAGVLYVQQVSSLELNSSFLKILFSSVIIVDIMWMFFSVMLVIGILKNRTNFVLSYFFFGIFVTILLGISGLLLILKHHWIITLMEGITALLYIHCLIMVHSAYELMHRGKVFGLNQHRQLDEDQLISPVA